MDRRDVASWLQGPKQALEEQGYDFGYKGERLGLPQAGRGSIAPMGRRLLALVVDWLASVLIAQLFFARDGRAAPLATMGVFALMTIVLLTFGGSSFGQRLFGVRIVAVPGSGALPFHRVVIRTVLLCLVVPPLIWDRDQRGLHDKAARSAAVLFR